MNSPNNITGHAAIHVLTSFAIRDGFDLGPTSTAIQIACGMQSVQRIHILSETTLDVAEQALPLLKHPKIGYITVSERPTFAELFNYCNHLELDSNAVVALMNSDISFAQEYDIEISVQLLNRARERGYFGVLAISRHDIVDGEPALTLHDTTGLPNCVTCDCWVFRPPLTPNGLEYVYLGDMNCDSVLAFNLAEAGYCLINPCIDVTLIHHEVAKNNDYYDALNIKQRSIDLLGWHWAKQCNRPYKTYGVPWTKASFIDSGYLPLPLIYQKQRIYLVFRNDSPAPPCLAILALTEIIARLQVRDLVVLYENEQGPHSSMIEQLGSVTRNAYMLPVANIDEVIGNLLSEKNWYGDSCVLISRFDYLTVSLLQEFHSVIFDGRSLDAAARIFSPVGYRDLQIFAEARYPQIQFATYVDFTESFVDSGYCTLITSVFRSDDFLEGLHKNITALNGYVHTPHTLLFSTVTEKERRLLNQWHYEHLNVILCWFKIDPGLYECWNIGIRVAQTEFVSNANVDDLRHPDHVRQLIEDIHSNLATSIAATALVPFYNYIDDIKAIDATAPWYSDQTGIFRFNDLARLDQADDGAWKLIPHNIPHCMPVWRKSLHEKHGFFDESKYGTYADWAFWLKVTKAGETGYLSKFPYAYYFVNQSSHNRRGDKLAQLHKVVESDFLADFYFRSKIIAKPQTSVYSKNDYSELNKSESWSKKLFLEGLTQSFGQHRNSFNRLIEALRPLHNENGGIRFIPFIERYFVWGTDEGEASSESPKPIQQDWIGILHVPFDAPKWFEYSVSPESIFATDLWKNSLPYCRGVICLTEDLRKDLSYWYPQLPSLVVKHPTELDVLTFNLSAYEANPRLVQAGDWLRRLQYIYELDAPGHQKVFLKKVNTDPWLKNEIQIIGDYRNDSVEVLNYISNEEYDQMLSSSVVVAWLYGTSANNIVLECIARRTPILINPLPGIVEYLGRDYPLYILDRNMGGLLLADGCRIRAAHEYLNEAKIARDCLSYQKFLISIAESELYKNL